MIDATSITMKYLKLIVKTTKLPRIKRKKLSLFLLKVLASIKCFSDKVIKNDLGLMFCSFFVTPFKKVEIFSKLACKGNSKYPDLKCGINSYVDFVSDRSVKLNFLCTTMIGVNLFDSALETLMQYSR
jgi:hypothetical protein